MRGARLTSVKTLAIVCNGSPALGSPGQRPARFSSQTAARSPSCPTVHEHSRSEMRLQWMDAGVGKTLWPLVLGKGLQSGTYYFPNPPVSRSLLLRRVWTPPPGFAHAAGGSPFLASSWRSTSSISNSNCCVDCCTASMVFHFSLFSLVAGPFTHNNQPLQKSKFQSHLCSMLSSTLVSLSVWPIIHYFFFCAQLCCRAACLGCLERRALCLGAM